MDDASFLIRCRFTLESFYHHTSAASGMILILLPYYQIRLLHMIGLVLHPLSFNLDFPVRKDLEELDCQQNLRPPRLHWFSLRPIYVRRQKLMTSLIHCWPPTVTMTTTALETSHSTALVQPRPDLTKIANGPVSSYSFVARIWHNLQRPTHTMESPSNNSYSFFSFPNFTSSGVKR